MRLPRVRFTVRRMMVGVAVLASTLGALAWLARRATEFRAMASRHMHEFELLHSEGDADLSGTPQERSRFRRMKHHYDLVDKYHSASQSPWLPVEPDPVEPK